jgi:hypothetical protein
MFVFSLVCVVVKRDLVSFGGILWTRREVFFFESERYFSVVDVLLVLSWEIAVVGVEAALLDAIVL